MLNKIVAGLLFLCISQAAGQWKDDFTGGQAIITTRYGVIAPTGTGATANGTMELVGDGTAMPYHASGPTNYGYIVKDSLLTTPFEAYIVFAAKGGTDNVRYFGLGVSTSKSWTTGVGVFGGMQEMTTGGGVDRYNMKLMAGGMATLGGSNPSDFAATRYINSEFAVGDTLGITVWADNRVTIWKRAAGGGARDSSDVVGGQFTSTTAAQHNFTPGGYVWIGGAELATPFKITEWGIRSAGAGGAPPAAADNNPPDASILLSSANLYRSQTFTVTTTATDDSALNQTILEADSGGGYFTVTTNTYAGTATSGSFVSGNITRHNVGTINVRARTSDHNKNDAAIRRDTTAVQTATFIAAPVVSASTKKVFAWLTFGDTRWPLPYNTGTIPADSLPWDVLTHVGLFAANGANPLTQTQYINQYGPMAQRAHSSGVFAGITVGGSGDAALVTMVAGGATSWLSWWNHYKLYLDGNGSSTKLDFLEFDFEGSYTAANIAGFFTLVYDSMQTRTSGNDPTKKPFIILTASLSNTIAWSSQAIRDRVEFVNMMTYDYNNNAWGRVTFDNSPKSYVNYDGTGGATDSVGTGVNAIAPSMQRQAIRAIGAGWPANKINVGVDFNGGSWGNATNIRQSTAGTTGGGSNATFAQNWATWSALPSDSIFFDQIAQAYWARVGTSLWTWIALPGRDSGIIATRKVIDSMGLGGVNLWNFGNEVWNVGAANIPSTGRGWHHSMVRRVFGGVDTVRTLLSPPTAPTAPADVATGVALSPTLDWPDVSGATKYNVELTLSTGTLVTYDSTLAVSQRAVGALVNNTAYRWRVRVQNANGWGQWSNYWTFTAIAATPGAPTIAAGLNGTTLSGTTVTAGWSASTNGPTAYTAGTSFYQIQVSTSSIFSSTFKADSGSATTLSRSYNITGMTNSTLYYVRVRAKTAGGYSSYSATVSFTTGAAAPNIPALSQPANNEGNVSITPTLSWVVAPNATSYRLQVDTLPTFATVLTNVYTASLSYTLSTLAISKTYYWRVKGIGGSDSSSFSQVFSFTTSPGNAAAPPPRATVQMGYWYDIASGNWIWNRPAAWIIYGFTRSDMSDVPRPDSGQFAWSVYGIKTRDTTLLYSFGQGGGTSFTMPQLRDSIRSSSSFSPIYLQNPSVSGEFAMRNADTSGGETFTAGFNAYTGAEHLRLNWEDVARKNGDDLSPRSLVLPTSRLGQPSGGFGVSPQDARDAAATVGFWGYDPSIATPEWSLLPVSSLKAAPFGILTNYGIAGPKIAYLDVNEVWQYLDTNYYRDAGGAGTNLSDATADSAEAALWIQSLLQVSDSNRIDFSDHLWAHRGFVAGDDEGLYVNASGTTTAPVGMGIPGHTIAVVHTGNKGAENRQSVVNKATAWYRTNIATFSDPMLIGPVHNRAATTTNASTLLHQVSLDSSSSTIGDFSTDGMSYSIDIVVVANRTDAAGTAKYHFEWTGQNATGTVTEVDEDAIGTEYESNVNLTCTVSVSGDYVQVLISGDTAQNWTWHSRMMITPVGN